MDTPNFYKQVATITRDRFSSTAERFIARLIRSHLHKDPETLQPQELRQLIDWIELAMRTIYSDQHLIDRYVHDLLTLLSPNTKATSSYGKKA